MADSRRRNFATIVYPESAPSNWVDILSDFHVPCFISPLHDQDVNHLDNEPKKAHYHVIIMFEGKKTNEQVKAIFDTINGVGLQDVHSLRGSARYLCHLDNPDKAQYATSDVTALCGADYLEVINLVSNKYHTIGEMIDFCYNETIYSYATLLVYARSNNEQWFRVLCDSGTLVMKEFLKSYRWEREMEEKHHEKYLDGLLHR